MNPIKLKILSAIFFIFFIFNLHGQEHKTDTIQPALKKNVVYGSIGIIVFGGFYSINAERMLFNSSGSINSIWIRFGGGEWIVASFGDTDGGIHLIGTINALTGSRASHFEANVGAVYLYNKYDDNDENAKKRVFPAAALGYRLQKPGNHFVLRTGIGFPEGLYLSLGFCF